MCLDAAILRDNPTWTDGKSLPKEWLAFNFSQQYHPWVKNFGQKNKENDHQLKQPLIIKKILFAAAEEMYTEEYGEYANWCQGVMGKGSSLLISTQDFSHFFSPNWLILASAINRRSI